MNKKKLLFVGVAVACMPFFASAEKYPYQDPSLTPEQRAEDLCSRLTLEEKASLMMNSSPAIERLGIQQFDWWSEALHGVGRNGLCTIFPSCIGMAASFDDDLIEEVFTAVSDEARAKNTQERKNNKRSRYKGLSFWTPNINIFRDPRWGRGQETYGEDPYMTGRIGKRVVRGLQGDGTSKYYKTLACAKHYAVHSGPESTRHYFNINDLPARDLWETYLPAFKDLVVDGGVREVMCAYQRFEDKPCCGSDRLLQSILRDEWDFDGLVVSDCGAIEDFWVPKRHEVAKDEPEAAAQAVLAGTDVECGSVYKTIPDAVRRGDLSEADLDRSVIRLLAERFRIGDFDDDSLVEWTNIPYSVVSSPKHRALARKMGQEQTVLLKNNGILPLAKESGRFIVMGPNAADTVMPWGIYYGVPAHTVSVLEGIEGKVGKVPYAKGCAVTSLTDVESVFDRFTAPDGKKGMKAEYWNNTELSGEPVTEVYYTTAVKLDNGGNTVFAPGVNLNGISMRLQGGFIADKDEELTIEFSNDDHMRLIINNDTLYNRWQRDGVDYYERPLKVKAGKKYDFTLDYQMKANGTSLNFDLLHTKDVTTKDIVDKADDYETVIFVGGITPVLEREEAKVAVPGFDGGDRTSIELPQAQRDALWALHNAGKKIIFINCSGGAMALSPENGFCDAIIQAWYPGEQGGNAIADILFGDVNPSGKLPVTFYTSDAQLPEFDEYRMTGRTYRYLNEDPLYPFGYGLSYTDYQYGKPSYLNGKLTVDVTNNGEMAGTETVQLYMKRTADTEGPNKSLRGYQRVDLQPGETKTVTFELTPNEFANWNPATQRIEDVPGEYLLMVGSSSADSDLQKVVIVR